MILNSSDDLLKEAALEYSKLVGKKIKLVLGYKGKREEIVILFKSSDFLHLAGLHKLSDIRMVYNQPAELVFNLILEGKINIKDINRSSHFEKIKNRLEILGQINTIFTSNNLICKFNKMQIRHGKIPWQYVIEFITLQGYPSYLFLSEYRNNRGNYACISCFKKKEDYCERQIKMTLLQAKMISEKQITLIFQNPSFIEDDKIC